MTQQKNHLFPNKDTILCISIAAKPSNFGMTVHNCAYRAADLNYLYKAFGISDLNGAIQGIRTFGIRGCSVSMPFKESVIPLLDELHPAAATIGAVNTIVNKNGYLKGYNTDVYGAEMVIKSLNLPSDCSVLLLGAGGVARAILYALKSLGIYDVTITNRSLNRLHDFNLAQKCEIIPWSDRSLKRATLLINCTPIGMVPDAEKMPIDSSALVFFQMVIDVVLSPPETRLIQISKKLGKRVAAGYEMGLHQAIRQFELYTEQEAPIKVMEDALQNYLHSFGSSTF